MNDQTPQVPEETRQYFEGLFGDADALYYNSDLKLLVKRAAVWVKYEDTAEDAFYAICNLLKFGFAGFWHMKLTDDTEETTTFSAYARMKEVI